MGGEPGLRERPGAHPYRSVVLERLRDHASVTLADLADEVAVETDGVPLHRVPAERVSDVYFALYDDHVPALERAGLVAYDQDRDLVSRPGCGADAPAASVAVVRDRTGRFPDGR